MTRLLTEGSMVPVAQMDVQVGGTRLPGREVQIPLGQCRVWFTGTYLGAAENQLLSYADAMADEHGNVIGPEQMGMPAGHPSLTELRVQLEPV